MRRALAAWALLLTTVARQGSAQSASLAFSPSVAADARLAPGVPHVLAMERASHIRGVHYDLALDVTRSDTARGTVVVRFTQRTAREVILDFRGLAVTQVIANGRALPVNDPALWNRAHLRIPASHARVGENTIRVTFETPIAAAGASIIRSRDATDGEDYLYTLLVPSDAHLLFPCFDQPDLKARVTLRITAPARWTVLANGAATHADTAASQVTHHFAPTQPISTYLIAFAAGPYTSVTRSQAIAPNAPPVDVRMLLRASRLKEAESDTLIAMNTQALRWLGDWFGVPYPFGKYDFLLAPAFPFGGMEHPGAVFYNEQSFIYRERPTIAQTLGRQATIYHEIAHQWFGDLVSETDWPHLWLSEGFATYLTHVYAERTRGVEALREGLARDRTAIVAFAAENPQRMLVDTTFADPMELLNAYSYQRGSWTLHLLRRRLGDDAIAVLQVHPWPGNVRQLHDVLFRAAVLCEGDALTAADFPHIAALTVATPCSSSQVASDRRLSPARYRSASVRIVCASSGRTVILSVS